jgi:hypothetical protein
MAKQIKQLNIPSQKTILDELKSDILTNMNCINIGKIESFDETDQTASISLSIKSIETIDANGLKVLKERPVLQKCPCVILSGGDASLTFPIKNGDTCLVLFNDREIDSWFEEQSGGIYPRSERKHDLSDAIALVGIRNINNAIVGYLTDGVRLKYNDSSKIDLTENKIESTAGDFKQNGDMEVTGDMEVGGNTLLQGSTTINNDLTVTGTINGGIEGVFEAPNVLLGVPFLWTISKGVIVSGVIKPPA